MARGPGRHRVPGLSPTSDVNPDCATRRAATASRSTDYFLDVLPRHRRRRPADRPGADPVPAAAGGRAAAVRRRCSGSTRTPRRIAAVLGGVDVWLAWWLLGLLRSPAVAPGGSDGVFRPRDGVLVHVDARHDVVLRPRRGGRADPARGRRSRCGPTGRRSTEALVAVDADASDGRRRDGRGPRAGGCGSCGRRGLSSAIGLRHRPLTLIDRGSSWPASCWALPASARLTVVFGLPFLAFVGAGGLGPTTGALAASRYGTAGSARPVGRARLRDPAARARRLQRPDDGPHLPSGLRVPLPAGGLRLSRARLQPLLVDRGPRATSPRTSSSCSAGSRRHAGLPGRAPRGRCSATPARSSFPQSIGMSLLLTSPAYLLAIPAAAADPALAADRRGRDRGRGDRRSST